MKFKQITHELNGARNAGFVVDFGFPVEFDDGFLKAHDKAWIEDFKDAFHDFEGDLFLGEDGGYYHVALDYTRPAPYPPAMWRRLKKADA